jgi:hypothetical protein
LSLGNVVDNETLDKTAGSTVAMKTTIHTIP